MTYDEQTSNDVYGETLLQNCTRNSASYWEVQKRIPSFIFGITSVIQTNAPQFFSVCKPMIKQRLSFVILLISNDLFYW